MAITDLPPELLVAVFSLLMAADLVNVKQVCRLFLDVLKTPCSYSISLNWNC